MEEKNRQYIRVRAALTLDPAKDILFRTIDKGPKFSEEFMDRLYEEDAKFREPIITFINDAIGTHTWGIQFAEFYDGKRFDANIYCADQEAYATIVGIICNRITDIEFIFHYKGTIKDYIGSQ